MQGAKVIHDTTRSRRAGDESYHDVSNGVKGAFTGQAASGLRTFVAYQLLKEDSVSDFL
jgi:sulfatase maturation enzyme AslB (radical SAM superfamily)